MIRALSGTVLAKATVAIFNLLVIALAGRSMGAEGVGTISLIVLAITIIMLLNNLVGGGALTYLAPRHAPRRLLKPTYLWAVGTAFVALAVVGMFRLVPTGYEYHVVVLAFIQSIYSIHLNILLGKERLRTINWLSAAQVIILFGVFYALIRTHSAPGPMQYIVASYVAFAFTLLSSSVALFPFLRERGEQDQGLLKRLFMQGGFIQLANVFQLLNYRLSYYFIQRYTGLAPLGIYSVSTQLSEGSWMIPKSIGTVLYMKVSNEHDEQLRVRTTVALMHLAMLAGAAVLAVLWAIPDTTFQWIFGEEITGIPRIIQLLTPGIVFMSGAQALSHYFSGTGRNEQNSIASGIGLALTVVFAFLLIPRYGLRGAAVTASIAYTGLYAYQVFRFLSTTGCGVRAMIPRWSSLLLVLKKV
jgi:O-antigen/teichoic acid export membrane protein